MWLNTHKIQWTDVPRNPSKLLLSHSSYYYFNGPLGISVSSFIIGDIPYHTYQGQFSNSERVIADFGLNDSTSWRITLNKAIIDNNYSISPNDVYNYKAWGLYIA